jgi:F-type H+-transporting ATPase subunit delta
MKTIKQTSREAEQLWRWCQVNGALDESRARLVVDSVIASEKAGWQMLVNRFVHRLKADRARRMARIESAEPLAPEVRNALVDSLTKRYGTGLTTMIHVNPALIAGVRVCVGSDVYDGSFKGRLAALEARF